MSENKPNGLISHVVWTFADQDRPAVKGITPERPILTGMTMCLNSTLSLIDENKKLPPCPILLLSTTDGILQVYYFIHKNLPPICTKAEELKPNQSFVPTPSPSNGFSFTNFGFSGPINSQPKEPLPILNNNNSQSILNTTKPLNGSPMDNITSLIGMNTFSKPFTAPTPAPQPQPQPQPQSQPQSQPPPPVYDNRKLLQMVNDFQSKIKSLEKPISKPSELSVDLDQSLDTLITTLNTQIKSFQTSIQSIKSMTREHIESMTKIEDARHQMKLSQTENLYHRLKDRELDPWTQARLESITTRYDKLKHDLNVLLQLTHTTIHDKSFTTNDGEEEENEDFVPDLEISLDSSETMKHRIQKRILDLSHKVSETEKDLETICSKLNKDILNGKTFDSTFTKTPMASTQPFHSLDAQVLSYLQDTHKNVRQIKVPSAPVIHFTQTVEQKKPSTTNEPVKVMTPSMIQPTTPKQANSPIVESESFKNMLRLVKTSIDLFSGVTSPEQLQELSNTIATSPLSSGQKSNLTSINKTPTMSKATNLSSKTSTNTKLVNTTISSTNNVQTPAKSGTSPLPTISVTPATPATQTIVPNKSILQTAPDLSRTQTMPTSDDGVIRSLLNTTVSSPTTVTSTSTQPVVTSTPSQIIKSTVFGTVATGSTPPILNQPSLSTTTPATTVSAPAVSLPSSTQSSFGNLSPLASTNTTSVQSTSPTTKSNVPGGGFSAFGSRPTLGGALNLTTTTASSAPFGSAPSLSTTTATTTTPSTGIFATATPSVPSPFGSGFGTPASTTAATSAPSTGIFSTATTSTPSPFGSGFGTTTTPATTSAPSTGVFGGGFGASTTAAATTSAPSTNIFGGAFSTSTTAPTTSAASTSKFGASPAITSPFGGTFGGSTSTAGSSPFGGTFAATSSAPTGTVFGGFGSTSTTQASTANTGAFGSGGGFGSPPAMPATSVGSLTSGTSIFGGGGGSSSGNTSTFGSSFSGFGTQSSSTGPSTGFSFGGFGNTQPSDATSAPSGFGSFGSPSSSAQPLSPFGGASSFGGTPGQSTGFGATSSFGASAAPSATSPSFTAYRK